MTVSTAPAGFVTRAGLRVQTEVLPWARSFAAVLVVGCGSRDDPGGREGVAHLVEHLLVIADPAAGRSGVPIFAVTEIDRTVYQATGDPGDVSPLIRRLGDIAAGGHMPDHPDVFEGERHAVVVETRRMDHQPLLRLGPVLAAAAADEPGLDAIGRTSAESIGRISHPAVADLVHRGYAPANAQLVVAGPAAALADLESILDRHMGPGGGSRAVPPARPGAASADRLSLPDLGDLVAVTLVRPRAEQSLTLDALLEPYGPVLGFGTTTPLRPAGRTRIEGRDQRVDIVVWRDPDAASALGPRLARTASHDWQEQLQEPLRRLQITRASEREWQLATPAGRVGDAASRLIFPGTPGTARNLALWRITGGVPQRLAEYPLVLAQR